MAVPSGTVQTFTSIGNREDLADIIYDISPMDTPFMSNIARTNADNVFTEWQTDVLAAAVATNAQIQGDDGNTSTAVPTVRLGNYSQILTKVPRVSGTERAINTAGRRDEFSYQIAKRGRELKRDIETTALGTQAATTGAAASASVMAGVASWLWNNQIQSGADSTTVAVTSGAPKTAPTAGTAAAFTEAQLKSAIALCWTEGGDPQVVMTNTANKQVASAFTGIATQFRDNAGSVGPAVIVGAADTYISDFGTHYIVANRFQPTDNVYVLDLEYWDLAYLRPIQQTELAKTGDSDRRLILAECTLRSLAPSSNAKVYTTT